MEFAGTLVVAWQWLKMGIVAQKTIEVKENSPFYQGKLHAMKFFFHYEVPKMEALAQTLQNVEKLTIGKEIIDYL